MVTNKFSKKKSKRMTCKRKYKIEKKVREHNRKVRKGIIKKKGRRSKKDPGVPNLAPFKEKILQEAEIDKKNALALKEKKKQEMREKKKGLTENRDALTELVQDAMIRSDDSEMHGTKQKCSDGSAKAFYKEFKKVVDEADVIIEVLDARDPLGSRSAELENTVLAAGSSKHLVLLLNKADLVPKENLKDWIRYLRAEFPTLAFKASTQRQNARLSQCTVDVLTAKPALLQSQTCLGASGLLQLLANYSRRSGDTGGGVTVGLVGQPNVGKSSVINSLKRARSCGVGARPGVTRSMQTVRLDSRVQLLDTPGLVLTSGGGEANHLALRNAVSVQNLEDPVLYAEAVLGRLEREQLMLHYRLPTFESTAHMLALLARRQGRLKTGGAVDVEAAARVVLHDWNCGRIAYHTSVPTRSGSQTQLVTELSKQLPLLDEDLEQMGAPSAAVEVLADDAEMAAASEGQSQLVVSLPTGSEHEKRDTAVRPDPFALTKMKARLSGTSDGDMALSKKTYRQLMKKRRKMSARNSRKVDALSDQLGGL